MQLTVSQLNNLARDTLEMNLGLVTVIGEISNLSTPSSGHTYFSLKDANAQVRCALFKMVRYKIKADLQDGMQVVAQARVSIYPARGDYQLIIQDVMLAGQGALQQQFEALKKKLQQQGLFSEDAKKELPELPKQIGVITSSTGAALRDILKVLKRRFASIPVIVYPTAVQGEQAANQIVKALYTANERNECDVLILARGGGSLEDLWPFNEEVVAHAIYDSEIPVVSGVGHEVDFTIADFVADVRAATPSAAAETVVPDTQEWFGVLAHYLNSLKNSISYLLQQSATELKHLQQRLRHPGKVIEEQMQKIDLFEQRMNLALTNQLKYKQQKLSALARSLNNVSPLNTLDRGYAILMQDQHAIRSVKEVEAGSMLEARLKDGFLKLLVSSE